MIKLETVATRNEWNGKYPEQLIAMNEDNGVEMIVWEDNDFPNDPAVEVYVSCVEFLTIDAFVEKYAEGRSETMSYWKQIESLVGFEI